MPFESILIVLYNMLVFGLLGVAVGYAVYEDRAARAERHLNQWLARVCTQPTKSAEKRRAA